MNSFYNIPIRVKLILVQLITTVVVVALSSLVFLYTDYHNMKLNKEKSLISIAHVLNHNSVAPLLFQDKETSTDILNDLCVEKDIRNASIFTPNKEVFSNYSVENSENFSFIYGPVITDTFFYQEDDLFIVSPIVSEKDTIGTLWIRADVSDLTSQLYKRMRLTFYVFVFGFLLSFILASFLQQYITRPINKLVGVMSQIIKEKNYSLRSNMKSRDEIGQMAGVFNKLLDDVEDYSKQLQETNNELERRVKERTEELHIQNQRLLEAKEKVIESNKIKEQFMASISHEIRTPLNAILGFQELLKDSKLTHEQMDYVNSIDFAGRNLLVLINDILDISKIESGKFIFNNLEMNFRETIQSVIEMMQFRAGEKKIDLSYSIDQKIPDLLFGDQARLSQILINLIGNAIKFTDKGYVRLGVSMLKESNEWIDCTFKVSDSGIGMAKDKLDTIFDRFTQISMKGRKTNGGTGLGLSIVKEIVELHGGQIEVQSKLGEGSVFTFNYKFQKITDSNEYGESIKSGKKESTVANSNLKLKGLLAEDIKLNQKLLRKIMQKWGYELDIVDNGKDAIEKVKKNAYDFILMDIQMPIMDGLEATKAIRSLNDEVKRNTPIIAITAQASPKEKEICLKMGMNAYMSKPFHSQKLKEIILAETQNQEEKKIALGEAQLYDDSIHLLDLSRVESHADGDLRFLSEIYEEFLMEMPEKLSEFNKLLSERNKKEIHALFHGLKGIFSTFGFTKGNDQLKILNSLIEDDQFQNEKLRIEKENFEELIDIACQEIRDALKKL